MNFVFFTKVDIWLFTYFVSFKQDLIMSYEIISESHTHRIVALSDTEVGKIPPINPLVFINVATGKEDPKLNFKMDIDLEINELHIKGFLHGDIEHPMRANPDFLFNNIMMTNNGLRLVDTGFSVIRKDEPDKFINLLRGELLEIMDFKEYFLGY